MHIHYECFLPPMISDIYISSLHPSCFSLLIYFLSSHASVVFFTWGCYHHCILEVGTGHWNLVDPQMEAVSLPVSESTSIYTTESPHSHIHWDTLTCTDLTQVIDAALSLELHGLSFYQMGFSFVSSVSYILPPLRQWVLNHKEGIINTYLGLTLSLSLTLSNFVSSESLYSLLFFMKRSLSDSGKQYIYLRILM